MTAGHYQVDANAAELYQRYLVPAVTSKWAEDLLARAQPSSGESVLDLACGTGVVARLAAETMTQGHVTGLDLNADMLRVARTLPVPGGDHGAPIAWIEGSALDLPFLGNTFDLVLCQLGLQFFPDRHQALREMRRVLRHSGRIALSVFGPIEHTPGANAFAMALDRVLGSQASRTKRSEHSFDHPGQFQNILVTAGFAAVDVHTVVQQIEFPSVLDYVRCQLVATPMAALLRDYAGNDRQAAISQIATETARSSTASITQDGVFSFPQEAYVATARKDG